MSQLAMIVFVTVVSFVSFENANAAGKALIYNGPGACEDGCASSAYNVAKMAGYDPVYVGHEEPNENTFKDAVIWIQPGGHASEAVAAMDSDLKVRLREFVKNGGGFVGFCAGAFVTTSLVGATENIGLGIFPGRTTLYGSGAEMQTVNWQGHTRTLYWEGGPYLSELPSSVEVIASYENGAVATARTLFGKGRVFITGLHPEAPMSWRTANGFEDPDGTDFDLAVDMIRWATEAH